MSFGLEQGQEQELTIDWKRSALFICKTCYGSVLIRGLQLGWYDQVITAIVDPQRSSTKVQIPRRENGTVRVVMCGTIRSTTKYDG